MLIERCRFDLKHTDGTLLRPATVMVSTVGVPRITGLAHMLVPRYETCVFQGDDSEVVQTYETAYDARAGHFGHCRRLGLVK